MQAARYLIRFDDICPTMNWAVWDQIESVMLAAGVQPVLAVVPDNQDPRLKVDPPLPQFWDRVRSWAARGWTVAVHGFQHAYISNQRGLVGLLPQSEFAGTSAAEQEHRLRAACRIFEREGLPAKVWIAPSHSFDAITVKLLAQLDFQVVHDGYFRYPYRDPLGLVWVPQQLWHDRPAPPGIWTVCYHCNGWTQNDLDRFTTFVSRQGHTITSLQSAVAHARTKRGLAQLSRFPALAFWLLRLQLKLWSLRAASPANPLPQPV
jgi:predicted deacetylase